jgi:hypothetical protein
VNHGIRLFPWHPADVRKPGLSIAIATGLFMAVCGCGSGTADAVKDPNGLAVPHDRFSLVLPELDAVKDPANAHAPKQSVFDGCVVDNSGDVYEPEVHREWNLRGSARVGDALKVSQGGRQAGQAIAAQLVARGWKGSTALDQDAATDLSKSFDGQQIHLGIQAFNDLVNVWADTKFRHVCNDSS